MCGRYTLRTPLQHIIDAFSPVMPSPQIELFPRYNVAPSQGVPEVRLDGEGRRVLTTARWGFIPSWAKGEPKVRPINAKCETAATSAMFRQAMARRRSLIPADGFYEWAGSKPPKQPYFLRLKGDGLFAFAGLWERWRPGPDQQPIETFAILTTEPNDLVKPIHNRMPVIIDPADYSRWLDPATSPAQLQSLTRPFPAQRMEASPVSPLVNSPGPSHVAASLFSRGF